MTMAVFVGKNNSKKISELKPRDIITTYKQNSWIPVSQYDHRIGSYTNLAINIDAITDYTESYAYSLMGYAIDYTIDKMHMIVNELRPDDWLNFAKIGDAYNPGYITEPMTEAVSASSLAQNLTTYAFSYTSYFQGWHYLFGKYEKSIDPRPEYIYTDLEEYILTEDGRMLTI